MADGGPMMNGSDMLKFPTVHVHKQAWRLAAVAAAAACCALAGSGLSGPARAAYLGSEGRIAFVRDGSIYSIKPAGAGVRLLAGGRRDSGPRWSPGGMQIAYVDAGNLWIMNADGSHKVQITAAAPLDTDGRPTWSPSGRYIAFVSTRRHAKSGYLVRYDTITHRFNAFTAVVNGRPARITALAGTAPAWARALNAGGSQFGYFVAYEGAGNFCPPHRYCLDAIGMSTESQFKNADPSAIDQTNAPARLTYPDWFPIKPQFGTGTLTSVETCVSPDHCSHDGIALRISAPVAVILPGAYQAVYSPIGAHIAFARNHRGTAEIYVALVDGRGVSHVTPLTGGSEPDWQPTAPFPPS
jgi:hypothetical protein